MQTVKHIADVRSAVVAARATDADRTVRVALVPTMGNLHAGHLTLVEAAQAEHDFVIASIFVNPLQFGAGEDFGSYPRTLEQDAAALAQIGTDLLFAPEVEELYPHGQADHAKIILPELADTLCGSHHPGHFDGVATVVMKLLNITKPDSALFGEKDFQQLLILKTMAHDFNLDVTIAGVPTVRADDGLALSSRNQYLTDDERSRAPKIHATLSDIAGAIAAGATNHDNLLEHGRSALTKAGFEIDYLQLVDANSLREPQANTKELRLLVAANLGRARLIDNIGITL